MVLTQAQLLRAVPDLNRARLDEFVASLNQWSVYFGIDTPRRMVMYLAHVLHESARLKSCEENMNYSTDGLMRTFPKYFKDRNEAAQYARKPERIANRVYANRMGNGDEASGDGWRYRGRAYIGITGKSMYEQYGKSEWCVGDPVSDPDLLTSFPENQKVSMWFWMEHDLNKYADKCDMDKSTRIINGGTNGLADRKFLYRRLCKEFAIVTT